MSVGLNIIRVALSLLGLCLLVATWFSLIVALGALPDRERFDAVTLKPDGDTPIILGHEALMQPEGGPTAARHVAITRNADGIFLYDIAAHRRVGYEDVQRNYRFTGETDIPPGASILKIGGHSLRAQLQGNQLTLWDKNGKLLMEAGPNAVVLHTRPPLDPDRLGLMDRLGTLARGHRRLILLGGSEAPHPGASATKHVPIPGLPRDSARLIFSSDWTLPSYFGGPAPDASWRLRSGRMAAQVQVDRNRVPEVIDAEARPVQLVDADGTRRVRLLYIGFTAYALSVEPGGQALTLRALSRVPWRAPETTAPLSDRRIERKDPITAQPVTRAGLLWVGGVLAVLGAVLIPMALFPARQAAMPFSLAVAGTALAFGSGLPLPNAILFSLGLGMMAMFGFQAFFSQTFRNRWIKSAFVALSGFALAGFAYGGPLRLSVPFAFQPFELALSGAWLGLAAPFLARRMPLLGALFWLILTGLVSVAAIAGLQLALNEPSQRWLTLADRHLIMMGFCGVVAAFVLALSEERSMPRLNRLLLPGSMTFRARVALQGVLCMIGVGFTALILAANETGFGGFFQPSEMAKSILVVLVAVTLSLDLSRRSMLSALEGGMSLWQPLVAFALGGGILFASILNYDMSPILVSAVSLFFMLGIGAFLHYVHLRRRSRERRWNGLPVPVDRRARSIVQPEHPRWRQIKRIPIFGNFLPLSLLVFGGSILALGAVLLILDPDWDRGAAFAVADDLRTPWKRLQSFMEMRLNQPDPFIAFSETGDQLKRAREALLEAGCIAPQFQLCPVLGPTANADEALVRLLRVQAVQDDFAAVNLIHTLGWDGALIYAAGQAMLIACLFGIGIRCLVSRHDQRMAAWMMGVAVVGIATVYAAQVGFAWGNALGLLPIMGQPMTFVSFGASHHLGVGAVLSGLGMLAAVLAEPIDLAQKRGRVELFRRRANSP